MFTNPHNQNLLNDVMRVLGGETTEQPIRPVPQWISEAAQVTAEEINTVSKSGVVMTSELRRDILRKNLSEAISSCNCEVSKETPLQFDEAVTKALATPSEVKAKTAKPETKSMPKNVGLASTGKNPAKIGEEVEIETNLREFLTQLTAEEVSILRNIINETR